MAIHILHLTVHWLLMTHFQQTVTWVGLELEGAGVIREGGVSKGGGVIRGNVNVSGGGVSRGGGVSKGGGVTRSGWEMDTFTITSTVWA